MKHISECWSSKQRRDLEDEGVEFLTADNGESALHLIQSEKPNLVFLDVMMPENKMECFASGKKRSGSEDVFYYSAHCPKDRTLTGRKDKQSVPISICDQTLWSLGNLAQKD